MFLITNVFSTDKQNYQFGLFDVDFSSVHETQEELHVTGVDVLEVDDGVFGPKFRIFPGKQSGKVIRTNGEDEFMGGKVDWAAR